ncbi:hypothetical protein CVT25_007129 [Psilocybe cyanescens]|uniref:Uncharacterized protein n=1 Tax=Psilocybe cyanescens TaxID=93625 RepID=A0A409XIH7_PSICY|nr:hypothetical protein CVT25_007129 [Psilocybe cyanescens]
MQEYEEGLVILCECKYHRALDELEWLVVQHLFEMKKLGMSSVGYKLWKKISKSLKTRAGAIQSALKRYNEAAVMMVPPRAVLTWESVIAAMNLADFDLLQDTRQDIQALEWVQPANCEGMVMYFQIKRAKEELIHLNVEIRHLLTFLYDNHIDHYRAICAKIILNPCLAFECRPDGSIIIIWRLLQTSRLPGFSGTLFYGQHKGRDPSLKVDIPPPTWLTDILGITEVEVNIVEVGDMVVDNPGIEVDTDPLLSLLDNISLADS